VRLPCRAAGAFQQNGTDLVILGRAPRRRHEAQRHVRIERVAPLGPVHGDREQAGFEVLQDGFVAHAWVPLLLLLFPPSFRDTP
jgi:hypothetical protein